MIPIRRANDLDAELLTALARVTFWDAFHEHPKNAPEDMAAYMAEAFSEDAVAAELADPKNIFLLAEIEGEAAGYAKLTNGAIEEGITAERPIELNRLYSHQRFLERALGRH